MSADVSNEPTFRLDSIVRSATTATSAAVMAMPPTGVRRPRRVHRDARMGAGSARDVVVLRTRVMMAARCPVLLATGACSVSSIQPGSRSGFG
jgi:hypothetical protein